MLNKIPTKRFILRELFTGKLRGSFTSLSKAMEAGSGFSYTIKEIKH
jgi:hypothetical protein